MGSTPCLQLIVRGSALENSSLRLIDHWMLPLVGNFARVGVKLTTREGRHIFIELHVSVKIVHRRHLL